MAFCRRWPGLLRMDLGGGCLNSVLVNALAAAECWAFLMLGPSASYSSFPSFRVTVKIFLCAGPCSPVRRYWCWILLYLAAVKKAQFAAAKHLHCRQIYLIHLPNTLGFFLLCLPKEDWAQKKYSCLDCVDSFVVDPDCSYGETAADDQALLEIIPLLMPIPFHNEFTSAPDLQL